MSAKDQLARAIAKVRNPAGTVAARSIEPGTVAIASRSNQAFSSGHFMGPGVPMAPMMGPPDVPDDEWFPRQWAYQAGRNLTSGPRADEAALMAFKMLRDLADTYDIGQICKAYVQEAISSTEFTIAPRRKQEGGRPTSKPDAIRLAEEFILSPDRDLPFEGWVKSALEDVMVCDNLSINPRRTRGGDLYAFEIIDGDTIKPYVDNRGRKPAPPLPAYQQTLYGINFGDFTTDELYYLPMNPRARSAYGHSAYERMILNINTSMRKQMSELAYFTEGNQPDALLGFSMGAATPTQVKQFQNWIDDRLKGDTANRRGITVVPIPTGDGSTQGKMQIERFAEPVWQRYLEEWMVQVCCAALYTTPSEIGFLHQTNRATSSGQENAQERRLRPLRKHIKYIIDRFILGEMFGIVDHELRWNIEPPVEDALKLSQIDDIDIRNGKTTPDECRERDGKMPWGGASSEPVFVAQSTFSLVSDLPQISALAAKPPEPKPASLPPGGTRGSASDSAGKPPVAKADARAELNRLNAYLAKGKRRPFAPVALEESMVKAIEAQSAIGNREASIEAARILIDQAN